MNFITNESVTKLRGGYYTPLDLAAYAIKWALEVSPKRILEPSCGDGAFFRALATCASGTGMQVTGIEYDAQEASKAADALQQSGLSGSVHKADFVAWAIPQLLAKQTSFDVVVGNPPFIRYQYLPADSQAKAEAVFKILGLPFTRHTNSWVTFVLASIALLRPGGRLAMVVPAELIHVMHAQPLRTYLARVCSRSVILDPKEIWFDSTLQGAVILLTEKKRRDACYGEGVGIVQVRGKAFLGESPTHLFNKTETLNGKSVEGKWTWALLSHTERELLADLASRNEVCAFSEIARCSVGIVTGANKFFLVGDEVVERYGLEAYVHPMFGRSEHCGGVIYDEAQHKENAARGFPTNFVFIRDERKRLAKRVLEYVQAGERESLHTRFKCRIRDPWYTVPHVYSAPVGMLKRCHDAPRLVLNRMRAYTTDTAYRIEPRVAAEKLVYCFMNSLTALSAELEGRYYGGGVLELVPSEIARLLVPMPAACRPAVRRLDRLVRATAMDELLRLQDADILGVGLGLPVAARETLASTWRRLRDRRQRAEPSVNLEDE